jgi:hypothetical protein
MKKKKMKTKEEGKRMNFRRIEGGGGGEENVKKS